ncbi:GNAT family N-acetyltransferase [Rhizobium wenxiniae]|uniref:GNAT family N-acetyltransferase n=1 Tax=Rhizobium wenxiniae TaxID=1737357 RepID=UPI001C6E15BD|nr:GNAT family N-acetyltransferase [Rhizobium wenxiniae]MBW9090582.1 GNAT family N-acetyltransferase [Rhizobium wenxiniae]
MLSAKSRAYCIEDRLACLAVFDSNVPHFFALQERSDYIEFLGSEVLQRPYLVVQDGKKIIGCGGLNVIAAKNTAFLSWGMVARKYHGMGVGRFLAQARLDLARSIPQVQTVTLNTSQHTKGFYEKFGFVSTGVTPDGYAPGLDRWDMILKLK